METGERNRRQETTRTEILVREKTAVASRIRRVCQAMSETEFEQLVTRIAEIEIKYRLRRRQET